MVTMVMVMVTMASPMMTWRPEVIIGVVGHPGSTGDAEEKGESDPDLFKLSFSNFKQFRLFQVHGL